MFYTKIKIRVPLPAEGRNGWDAFISECVAQGTTDPGPMSQLVESSDNLTFTSFLDFKNHAETMYGADWNTKAYATNLSVRRWTDAASAQKNIDWVNANIKDFVISAEVLEQV
jgi:hypothetical protein